MDRSIFHCRLKKVISLFMSVCFLFTSVQPSAFSAERSARTSAEKPITSQSKTISQKPTVSPSSASSKAPILKLEDSSNSKSSQPSNIQKESSDNDLIDSKVSSIAMSSSGGWEGEGERPNYRSVQVDVNSSSGSATRAVPVSVPPGRAGLQPNIVIAYNSSLKDTILGMGWGIDLGYIARSTKKGIPQYNMNDTFIINVSGGSQELVLDDEEGFYRSKIEGEFSRTQYNGTSWVVTDKKGIKYYYGDTDDSRQYNSGENNKVFKWYLNKVEDVNGNYMTITYVKDNNAIYPQLVEYTGNSITGDLPFAQVVFDLENRDTPFFSYKAGFFIKTSKRVDRIVVKVDGVTQGETDLVYAQSQATQKDLLAKIDQYGKDGTMFDQSLLFNYLGEERGFELAQGWNISTETMFAQAAAGYGPRDMGIRVADVNSDGYPDFLKYYVEYYGQPHNNEIFFYNGQNGWEKNTDWDLQDDCSGFFCNAFVYFNSSQTIDLGLRIADINGDGRVDVLINNDGFWYNYGEESYPRRNYTFLNDIEKWSSDIVEWHSPELAKFMVHFAIARPGLPTRGPLLLFLGTVLSDVNGDGYSDIVRSSMAKEIPSMSGPSGPYHKTFINNMPGSTGWTEDVSWGPEESLYTDLRNGAQLVDLNGDGLPEIFYLKDGVSKIYSNTGSGWQEDTASPWLDTFGIGDLWDGSTQFADINGDGLLDMIVAKGSYAAGSRTLINTGYGWAQDDDWVLSEGNFQNLGTRLLDANSDGSIDFMINYNGETPKLYLNKGKPVDLLESIDNGVGGKTTIEYDSATHYSNTFLSFPFPVVKSITTSDTMTGDSYKTIYEYANGLWAAQDREFRGFGYVKVEDPNGNYSETYFLQDDLYKGRIDKNESYNSAGQMLSKTKNTWGSEEITSGVSFVYLSQTDNYSYDYPAGGQVEKHTAVNYFYGESPQYGNLTQSINQGDVNVSGDEMTTTTEYHNLVNESDYLIGLPKRSESWEKGEKANETWLYYDEAQDWQTLPVKGFLTKKKIWAGDEPGAINPEIEYSYDAYGNLESSTDPRGKTSSVIYDSDFHMFPVSVINPLNQSVTKYYYGVEGVPLSGGGYSGLFGQLKSVSDINGITESYVYDTFGRLVKVVGPRDTLTLPSLTYQYYVNSDHMIKVSSKRLDHGVARTVDSAEFADGLGRGIQVKTNSGQDGKYIIAGQKEYDNIGRVLREYLPHAVTTTLTALDEIPVGLAYTLYEYDDQNRVTKRTNPDNTFASFDYDLITNGGTYITTAIDENGHQRKHYTDIYGRVFKIEEYSGADGRSPLYPQEPFQLYATTQYEYGPHNQLEKVIDAHGNETVIQYDKLGRKKSMDDPDMGHWEYGYDANGNMKWQIDAKGQRLDFTYDDLNRLVNKTDGADIDVTYTYDINPEQYGLGRLGQVEYGAMSGNDLTRFFYDEFGRETQSLKVIDGIGYYVGRDYDGMGNLNQVQYPDGNSVHYHYDDAGRLDAIANDPVMFEEVSPAPAIGEPLSKAMDQGFWGTLKDFYTDWVELYVLGISPAYAEEIVEVGSCQNLNLSGKTYQLTRDLSGAEVTDKCLNITASAVTLDCQGHKIENQNLSGSAIWVGGWDADVKNCNLVGPTSGSYNGSNGIAVYWSKYSNIHDNNVTGFGTGIIVHGDQNVVDHNVVKNSIKGIHVRLNGNVVKNNLVKNDTRLQGWGLASWEGPNAQFINNKVYGNRYGNVLYNADNTTVRCDQYSSNSIKDIYAYGGSNNVGLNGVNYNTRYNAPDSNFIIQADACMDVECNWEGDVCIPNAMNQPPQFDIPNEANALSDQSAQVSIVVTDADQDELSFISEQNVLPLGAELATVSSTAGRLEATLTWTPERSDIGDHNIVLAVSDGNDEVTDEIIFHVARGAIVEDPKLYVSDVDYNVMGQIEKITYATGTIKQYVYDDVTFRVERIFTVNSFGVMIQDLNYAYDSVGNIIAITDNVNTATQTFLYDHLNRLVEASAPATYGTKAYRYDEVGNILEKDGKVFAYAEDGSRSDGAAAGPHAVSSLNDGASFIYDLNGNMTTHNSSRGNFVYHFDPENRLASIDKSGAASVDFRYDGDGGRTKKVAYGVVSGIPVSGMAYPELLQDGAGENDLVTHFIGSLYEVDNLHEVKHIYMGSERILSVRDGEEQYIHGDHLGSSNVVEDQHGEMVQINEYQPFGGFSRQDKYTANGQESDLYFTQQILDDETGLYYYGARYYDPLIGRFISADSIVQAPTDPQSLNRYAYCRNNPVVMVDPDGHFFFAAVIAIVKAVAVFTAAHPFIAGAVIGGLQGGISASMNGGNVLQGMAIGAGIGWATGGINSFIPGGGTFSKNLLLNMGYHGARGAAIGAVMGGGINAALGGEFGDGAKMGAMSGGIGGLMNGFTSSEQFQNWVENDNFMTNSRYSAYQSNRLAFEEMYFGSNEYAGSAGLAASGDLNGYRHSALIFGDRGNTITGGWGKYPASNFKGSVDFLFGASRPGVINNELDSGMLFSRSGVSSNLFSATSAQLQAGYNYVAGPAGVQSLKTNCADWALRGFREMGYFHPSMRTFTHTDPAKVQKWISTYSYN